MPFAGIIEKVPLPSNIQFYQAKKHLDKIIYRIADTWRLLHAAYYRPPKEERHWQSSIRL